MTMPSFPRRRESRLIRRRLGTAYVPTRTMSVFSSASPALREAIVALLRHRLALIALAAFMATGIVISNDHGISAGGPGQRDIGIRNLSYVLGDTSLFPQDLTKFYGAVFEVPLVLVERALGLEDSRDIYLSRLLLTHFFFLTGGLFAYLLGRRLFDGNALALFAMLLFLLHPRVYGAAFGNLKDIPFISMFMITLFLAHRAFRKDALLAFALLGLGAGILINIRIMGVVLLAGVLGMQAMLLFSRPHQRKRVLLNGGVFALATGLVVYASLPYLWPDPISRSIEWWVTLSRHPQDALELFRGRTISTQSPPADYIPTWFSITSPPFMLLLGAAGVVGVLLRRIRLRRQAISDANSLFEAFIIGCFAVPLIAVLVLDPVVYSGWRQMFFLWAPFSLLAAYGLRWLLEAASHARLQALAYGTVTAGLGATLATMALLHPFQNFYFNFLTDRTTPEYLKTQYRANTHGGAHYAMKQLLGFRPSSPIALRRHHALEVNRFVLPESDRNRLDLVPESIAEFAIERVPGNLDENALRAVKVYNDTLWAVVKQEPGENPYPAIYRGAVSGVPAVRAEYDVYVNRANRSLVYVKEPCASPVAHSSFFLLVFPENVDDLPTEERSLGRANRNFPFYEFGSAFEGKCVAEVPLPDYNIVGIRTGQLKFTLDSGPLWEATFPYESPAAYRAVYRSVESAEPNIRDKFNVHFAGDEEDPALIYAREPCAPSDVENPFFLHVTPERENDLPSERRELGFDAWDFDFLLRGIVFDGKCVAQAPLPDYPIASIRTGQWIRGEGEVWEATLPHDHQPPAP